MSLVRPIDCNICSEICFHGLLSKLRFEQAALPPRRPYSRVFLAPSRRHLRIRFGSKVHSAARSSILGHRVSGNAIRNGGVPALVHSAIAGSFGQERDFHSARPRLLWKTLISTSLLRSHYKGNAGMRPERRFKPGMDGGLTAAVLVSPPHHLRTAEILSKRWGPPQALAAMSEGVDQTRYSNLVNIGKVMAGDTKSSFYVNKPVFNDFDDKSITTLMWQLYLLISANERSEVKEAISQSNEIVNRIQQVRFAAANDLNDSGSAAHTKKRAHKTDDEDALNKEYGQADVYAKVQQLSKQVRW